MIRGDPVVTDCCIVSSLAAIRRHNATSKGERLGACDESVDALIEVLAAALREDVGIRPTARVEAAWPTGLIETVATLVLRRIEDTRLAQNNGTGRCTDSGTYWRGETQ